MKYILITLSCALITLFNSCSLDFNSENDELFRVIKNYIPQIESNSEVYIVHPENCGACSVELIEKLSKKPTKNEGIYVLSTSEFPNEYDSIINCSGLKIKVVDGEQLFRKGILQNVPQKLIISDEKILNVSEAEKN